MASCLKRQPPSGRHGGGLDYRPLGHRGAARPCCQLHGTYGLAVLFRDWPDVLIVARLGSPIVLGVGDGEHFVASDASPLAGYTDKIVYLADHELAVLTAEFDADHPPRRRATSIRTSTPWS